MKYSQLLFFMIIVLASCNKSDIKKGTPDCIVHKINDFDKESGCDDRKVDRYKFQGQDVYVFEPGTCGADMTSEVVDDQCNTLGYLGGITGNTEINGEFFSSASFQENIWKK